MEMEGQLEKLLQGQVVATADYTNARKAIGVSDEHLQGDPCPLGKQGAFKKAETIETFDVVGEKSAEGVTETLDFTAGPASTPEPTSNITLGPSPEPTPVAEPAGPKFILPEAPVSDIATGNPVEVEPLDALQTMIPDKPAEVVTEPVVEEVPTEMVLPTMDNQVVAEAPTAIDENLFVNAPGTPEPTPTELPQSAPATSNETKVDPNMLNETIVKALDQLKERLKAVVDEEVEKYKADLLGATEKKEENVETALQAPLGMEAPAAAEVPAEDSLMAAALDQINNISEVPELDVPTL